MSKKDKDKGLIDTERLAGAIMQLAEEPVPQEVWDTITEIACGPKEQQMVILGLIGVAVHTLRKSGFPKGAFVQLKLPDDAPAEIRVGYQMLSAFLNDDSPIGLSLSLSACNQGQEWADTVLTACVWIVRNVLIEFISGGGRLTP